MGTKVHARRWAWAVAAVVACGLAAAQQAVAQKAKPKHAEAAKEADSEPEPPVLNPFGTVRQDRDDAVPGYLELSDGTVYPGSIYMTRDKRLKIWDASLERQRELPLRVVRQIECKVEKEWIEKEWKFKELALDEKMFTGRSYPSRTYNHTVTLRDGRKLTGPMAEVVYVRPFAERSAGGLDASPLEAKRFLLNKRNKGEAGQELKSLVYVKLIKLGKEAYEEGKERAAKGKSAGRVKTGAKKKAAVEEATEEKREGTEEK